MSWSSEAVLHVQQEDCVAAVYCCCSVTPIEHLSSGEYTLWASYLLLRLKYNPEFFQDLSFQMQKKAGAGRQGAAWATWCVTAGKLEVL